LGGGLFGCVLVESAAASALKNEVRGNQRSGDERCAAALAEQVRSSTIVATEEARVSHVPFAPGENRSRFEKVGILRHEPKAD
jgi:hypothetical protein